MLTLALAPASTLALEASVGALLGGPSLTLDVRTAPGPIPLAEVLANPTTASPARASVWVDGTLAGRIQILVFDPVRERAMLRTVEAEPGTDRVALESAAQIVASAVEAILEGEAIGIPREEAQRALSTTPEPTALDRQVADDGGARVILLGGYEVDWWSTAEHADRVVAGPALSAGVSMPSGPGVLGATLRGEYRRSTTIGNSTASATIAQWGLRATGEAGYRLGPNANVGGFVGGGLDVLVVDSLVPRTLALAPVDIPARPIGFVSVGARLRVTLGYVTLELSAGADVYPQKVSYVLEPPGESTTVFRTARFRPWAALAAGASL